jgi:hypothetical protein
VRRLQEHRWIQRPGGTAGGHHEWTVWPTVYSLLNGVVPVPDALGVHLQREGKSAGPRDDVAGGILRVIQGLGWIGRYAFETWDGSDVYDWTAASVTYYNVGFNAVNGVEVGDVPAINNWPSLSRLLPRKLVETGGVRVFATPPMARQA